MGLVVDIIIIALIALSTFLAYKKGLAALAIKLFGVVVAVVVTLFLYKPISNFIINTTSIDEAIQNAIMEKSYEIMKQDDKENELVATVMEQAKTNALNQTAKEMSIQIINLGVIVILFFGIKIALRFVTVIANKVASLPIINKFNKAGGIVYGLVRGLVIVYTCLLLIGFVAKVNQKNFLYENVNNSNIGKMMYENNVFNILL